MEKVYVMGGAQTDYSRNWSKEGKNVIGLLTEVIEDGLKEAGLTFEDVSMLNKTGRVGVFVGNFIGEMYISQGHLGALVSKVNPSFSGVPSARYEAACASGSAALDSAITKIKVQDYDLAIVVGWELMKTVNSTLSGDFLGRAAYYSEEAEGIEYPFPKLFGRLAEETINKYSLDEDKYLDYLAIISNKNYQNAKRNPNAQTRKWFMSKKQAQTRGTKTNAAVGGKLAISDCSQVTDGAAVVILASSKFITDNNMSLNLPIVKGWGHRVAPMNFDDKMIESKDDKYILPWTRQTVVDAYNRAGLTVADIDVFEIHDCFTSSEYAAISALGLTEPGEEFKAIDNGSIFLGGSQPINPSGGLIGGGHPVGASGVRMFLDLYKQICNKAGNYQVDSCRNGLMLNLGGSATTNYAFIIGKDAKD